MGTRPARRSSTQASRSCATPPTSSLRQDNSAFCSAASGILVETLLERDTDADIAEAEAAIERLAETVPSMTFSVLRDIWLLRLRALMAQARGDDAGLRETIGTATATWRNRLASRGTSRWAEAMP